MAKPPRTTWLVGNDTVLLLVPPPPPPPTLLLLLLLQSTLTLCVLLLLDRTSTPPADTSPLVSVQQISPNEEKYTCTPRQAVKTWPGPAPHMNRQG